MLKRLQPAKGAYDLAEAMLRDAWEQGCVQVDELRAAIKRESAG